MLNNRGGLKSQEFNYINTGSREAVKGEIKENSCQSIQGIDYRLDVDQPRIWDGKSWRGNLLCEQYMWKQYSET